MTDRVQLIDTIQPEEHPIAKQSRAQQELVWTLCSSVVGLVGSLSEASDEILEAITKTSIITNFLFVILGHVGAPNDMYSDVLSCLATLSEDNPTLAKTIIDHDTWLNGLMALRASGGLQAVASCGVLHNVFTAMQWFDHNTPVSGASDAAIIPTLVDSINHSSTQQNAASSSDDVLQLALEITASIATTLQDALEHASQNEKEFDGFDEDKDMNDSLINGEDTMDLEDGDEDDMEDDIEDDNDELTEEMEADMARVTGADDAEEEVADDQPTLHLLIKTATPAILQLVKSKGSDNEQMRDAGISALSNISWTMSSIDFSSSSQALYHTWSALAQQLWNDLVSPVLASNTADITLASSVTSLAWALARGVQGKLEIQPEEQRKFMALYQASKGLESNGEQSSSSKDAFQGLGVKCIGVLGRLALPPAPIDLNREIGVFLLTTLAALPETRVADSIEALDQLFDIYADKEYECDAEVFVKDGFLKHLEAILPKTRIMAKSVDKRKDVELRARADEAVLNLDRFIKYKRSERRS